MDYQFYERDESVIRPPCLNSALRSEPPIVAAPGRFLIPFAALNSFDANFMFPTTF